MTDKNTPEPENTPKNTPEPEHVIDDMSEATLLDNIKKLFDALGDIDAQNRAADRIKYRKRHPRWDYEE